MMRISGFERRKQCCARRTPDSQLTGHMQSFERNRQSVDRRKRSDVSELTRTRFNQTLLLRASHARPSLRCDAM